MPLIQFIQVILPLKIEWEPYYRADAELQRGDRVTVNFSGRRYVAVVIRTGIDAESIPENISVSKIRQIEDLAPGFPRISGQELELWSFMADYYLCTIGEVYLAAYPHSRIRSEEVAARASASAEKRHEAEMAALGKRAARLRERLSAKEEALEKRRSSKRATSAEITGRLQEERDRIAAELESLEQRIRIMRDTAEGAPVQLSTSPAGTVNVVRRPEKPVLIVSADRSAAYADAIRDALSEGRSALVLTPDNLNCRQLEDRLKADFPELMTVSSGISAARRRKISDTVRTGRANVVLGTRVAIFLPFTDLGLIIINDEQDPYFKQTDIAPRYNARDCAMKLAQIHKARVILGTSSPSLETVLNVRTGKYTTEAATLSDRSAAWRVRNVEVVDMGAEKNKRGVTGYFSFKLIDAVRNAKGKVVLIRGWEKTDELMQQTLTLFPGRVIEILKYQEAREADLSEAGLVAILQADALVDKDDFRADERAAQIVAQLASGCKSLMVQTTVKARFDGSRSMDSLLEERRSFGFPPFTRLVEYRLRGTGTAAERFFLKRDASLASRKKAIASNLPEGSYIDVDPQ